MNEKNVRMFIFFQIQVFLCMYIQLFSGFLWFTTICSCYSNKMYLLFLYILILYTEVSHSITYVHKYFLRSGSCGSSELCDEIWVSQGNNWKTSPKDFFSTIHFISATVQCTFIYQQKSTLGPVTQSEFWSIQNSILNS